ncbi:MAG: hypothetical protein KDB22_11560 [Planctomycetales bacterium]|nr:hypothetical protein [Planctomycetales bacterium]
MENSSRPSLRFFLVAYRKDGRTVWCKTPMDANEAEEMVGMLRQAGVPAIAISIGIAGDLFDPNDELTFEAESQA